MHNAKTNVPTRIMIRIRDRVRHIIIRLRSALPYLVQIWSVSEYAQTKKIYEVHKISQRFQRIITSNVACLLGTFCTCYTYVYLVDFSRLQPHHSVRPPYSLRTRSYFPPLCFFMPRGCHKLTEPCFMNRDWTLTPLKRTLTCF